MDDKIQRTADKTLEALGRVERFLKKYGGMIEEERLAQIEQKLKELQRIAGNPTDSA
jgi:hypothetical protein